VIDEALVALLRARIIGLARRRLLQLGVHRFEEALAQVPAARHHEHLAGVAVEAGVLRDRSRDVLGLELQLLLIPITRHDQDRSDRTELSGKRPRVARVVLGFALRLLRGIAAPHDRVVRAVAAGDVQRVDMRMGRQMRAHLGAAVDDLEEAVVDQARERALQVRAEHLIDGVHLQDDDLVFGEQLVEHVHRRDGRNVAGTEHERDLALRGLRLAVDAAL
jgi:hypothetical protein